MNRKALGTFACWILVACSESSIRDTDARVDAPGAGRCGDGVIDDGEECDDGNAIAFDGCEPETCVYSCSTSAACADANPCNGDEVCSDTAHLCVDGADPEAGTPCTLPRGASGVCSRGSCVSVGCGNGIVEAAEHCDDGNATPLDGCENDCRWSCEVDPRVENVWYLDCDGDGYSIRDPEPRTQCEPPTADPCGGGWTLVFPGAGFEDCDDASPSRHPGAAELCDAIDQDCDGSAEAAGAISCDAAVDCETDSLGDEAHCGACDNVCGTANATSALCTAGACTFTCSGPYRHCSTSDSTGCETNVGTDPEQCGSCGHSCLGGECVSGNCRPIVLAGDSATNTGLWSLYGLAVSDGYLYGTDWYRSAGLVYRIPVAGNPDRSVEWVVTSGGRPCPASPMVNDGSGRILYGLFRTEAGCPARGIWEIDPDGTTGFVVDASNINLMAADASNVYFTSLWANGMYRWSRTTGGSPTFHQSTRTITSLFAEAGSIYFSASTETPPGSGVRVHGIYAASPGTLDSPIPLATPTTAPSIVRTDASYLYYADAGRFFRVDKLGATPPEDMTPSVASLPGPIGTFLVDASYVYYVGGSGPGAQTWYAFRTDRSSTSVRMVGSVSATDVVSAVAQDASALYWTTYGTGDPTPPFSVVSRLAKLAP